MRGNEIHGGAGVRWPWRRTGGWTPVEAAVELQRRLPVLVRELARRPGARGVPALAREEILLEAISAVTVEGQPIRDEPHLLGALWVAVEFRLRRWHEGRHHTRLGSQQRVPLDPERIPTTNDTAYGRLEQLERTRQAADHLADLTPLERQITTLMASQGVGPLMASRQLDLPLGDVRSAARSARLKLDRVAAIAEAGRMCAHRQQAVTATAHGTATPEQQSQARAHLAACRDCRDLYHRLQRETADGQQPCHAIAALLPGPAVAVLHRFAGWVARCPTLPSGAGERATQLAAGGGLAKAAAATTAIIVAATTLTGGLHVHHHHRVDIQRTYLPITTKAPTPLAPAAQPTPTPPPAVNAPAPTTSSTATGPATGEHLQADAPSVAEREFTPTGEATGAQSSPPEEPPESASAAAAEPPAHAAAANTEAAVKEFGELGR